VPHIQASHIIMSIHSVSRCSYWSLLKMELFTTGCPHYHAHVYVSDTKRPRISGHSAVCLDVQHIQVPHISKFLNTVCPLSANCLPTVQSVSHIQVSRGSCFSQFPISGRLYCHYSHVHMIWVSNAILDTMWPYRPSPSVYGQVPCMPVYLE